MLCIVNTVDYVSKSRIFDHFGALLLPLGSPLPLAPLVALTRGAALEPLVVGVAVVLLTPVVAGVVYPPRVFRLGVALILAVSAALSFALMNVVSPPAVLLPLPLCSIVETSCSRCLLCLLNRLIESTIGA